MERRRFLPSEDKFSQSVRIVYGDGPTIEELEKLRFRKFLAAYALHFCQEFARTFYLNPYYMRSYIDYVGEVQRLSHKDLSQEKIREAQYTLYRTRELNR